MIKGTPISSPIISNNGNPTHYDEFGVGGYREVSTKNDMYNLSSKLLKIGCLVYVQEEDKIYKYKGNSLWEELKFKDDTPVTPPVKAKSYRLSMRVASTNNTVVLTDVENNTETTANIPVASTTNLGEIKLGYLTNNKNYALLLDENNRAYVNVPWTPGTGGGGSEGSHITQFTSFAFIRSKTKPSTPSGGTYENPVPNGWSDGIPEGTDPVWFSTRIFNSDNSIAGSWSTPTLLTDSASMDVCYSNSNTRPDAPTTHGTLSDSVWHNDAQPNDIWMAMSTRTSITENWSNWEIFRIKGENGEDGTSLKVVGTYDNSGCGLVIDNSTKNVTGISESNIKFADSSHTLTVGDCLQVVDSCNPSYNGHIIVLVDNNPKKWQDLGAISGKDGKSSYVHVKWSNNVIPNDKGINTNENASFTEQDGEVPGIYRGEYVDDNPNDSTDINKYRWVRAKGLDGFSYWFFYTATNTNKKPTGIPTVNSVSDLLKVSLTASDGTIWYDEIPTDTSIYDPETLYLWLIWTRDDESSISFRGPVLYAAPSSDGVAYNIVVNNEGIYWSSDNNSLTSESTNKNLNIIVYKNESVLDFNSSTEYSLEASVLNSDKNTSTNIAIVNNSVIEFRDINPNIYYPQVFIYLKKSGNVVYQYLYNIPLEGKTGPLGIPGIPGIPADTGITIMLSNDVAHIPCNSDNSPISTALVLTDIEVFKGDTNVTNSVALGPDSNTLNSPEYSLNHLITYDHSAIHNTVLYSNGKYTLTSELISTDNNYLYLVPIYIKYNDYVYTKYFTIRKDYTGDVYELIVTPQVYTDKDTDKTLDIKVNRTYSRTGHPTGVITSTDDSEYENLKITINDGNKLSIIGYTTTKLDQASFDVKLYEKDNLIDEEVVSRVVGTQGALGIQGCILRNRGYWNSEVTDYVNEGEYAPKSATEIRYIDYVFLKGSSTDNTTPDKCYRVKYASELSGQSGNTNGKVTVQNHEAPSANSEYWTEATYLEFTYIKDLIALLISALTITADEFLVKRKLADNSTLIVGGMVKGDTNTTKTEDNVVFFAGTSATDTSNLNTKEAKTYITEGGKLHSLNAEIIGSVTANELIVSDLSNKNMPNIIFTVYKPTAIVNTYDDSGTIVESKEMSSFNNIKDSNGNSLLEGSPIGIVYTHNITAKLYLPIYFFDFAPLTVKTSTAISVFSSVEGAATNSASSKFNIYLGSDSIYYSDNNLTSPYNGVFYVKYAMNLLITTINNSNSKMYLLPYQSYIILSFNMSNGKSGTYNGLYVYCTKYVDSYGNVESTGVYLTNMFESSTALDVSTFANSAYWYNNSSTTKAWTSIKQYKLSTETGSMEVGTTNIRFYTNFDTEINSIPSIIKKFYGTSITPLNLYNSNDTTKLALLFGVKLMMPSMDDITPKLDIWFLFISLNTYNK